MLPLKYIAASGKTLLRMWTTIFQHGDKPFPHENNYISAWIKLLLVMGATAFRYGGKDLAARGELYLGKRTTTFRQAYNHLSAWGQALSPWEQLYFGMGKTTFSDGEKSL